MNTDATKGKLYFALGSAALLCLGLALYLVLSARYVAGAIAMGAALGDLCALLLVWRRQGPPGREGDGRPNRRGWIWMGSLEVACVVLGAAVWAATGDWYWTCWGLGSMAVSLCGGIWRTRNQPRGTLREFLVSMWD